ncbi:MAG: T9SS type A sorting domain-containing protein [Flavobacteriales bacterium]|nr:T9SS type A sorting domain-containing protein [Flavobacteriales bacterium]
MIKIKLFPGVLVLLALISGNCIFSQNPQWEYLNFPYSFNDARIVSYEDTIEDVVYLGGQFYPNEMEGNNSEASVVSRFDGSEFEVIGEFSNRINSIVEFQGEIYVCGSFSGMNDTLDIDKLARYNGTNWEPVGGNLFNGQIYSICSDSQYLYAGGSFTEIDGEPVSGIARYNGENWESLPAGGFDEGSWIIKMLVYNNELVVGGDLSLEGELLDFGLLVNRNNQWQILDQENLVGSTTVREMIVWGSALYVVGNYFDNDEYLHPTLLKWDGEEFSAPWSTFYDISNQISGGSTPACLIGTTEYLYAGGRMEYIGDKEINQLAVYNDEEWCGMYTDGLQSPIYGMFSFRDTLYAYQHLNPFSSTLYPSGLYKWLGGSEFELCVSTLHMDNVENTHHELKIHPNPVKDNLNLQFGRSASGVIRIYNLQGKQILQQVKIHDQDQIRFNVETLDSGAYIIWFIDIDGFIDKTILIKS